MAGQASLLHEFEADPAAVRPLAISVLASCLAAAAVALAYMGGLLGAFGVCLVAALAWRTVARSASQGGSTGAAAEPRTPSHEPAGEVVTGLSRVGAEVMVGQIVPVWERQILAARSSTDEGLSGLLESFNGFSSALDDLAQQIGQSALAMSPGSVDRILGQENPALAALLTTTRRAFAERDAAVGEVKACAEGLTLVQQQLKQAREIARHMRLVAFNASIEAQRSDGARSESGSQAVASEVRMLASRMADTTTELERLAVTMHERALSASCQGEVHDTSARELEIEMDLRAREAIAALSASLGASLQSSSAVQQISTSLRSQIEDAYVQFQFGDRVSQMLAIVAEDMHALTHWVAAHPRATQSDAADWLAALEESYTMEEQRSQHHGNVHVGQSNAVEFF